ncbi:MAG: ribosome biogenesis GTPase Der [Chloroflexi bacterium]|nr:ribosome biogenesis GTPase Der [Chloroflexota bacterium]
MARAASPEEANIGQDAGVMPVVAIVGRPNVGKSTLFNRLTGQRRAVVADEAGTTRDRVITPMEGPNRNFFLVDTGGIDLGAGGPIGSKVSRQVRAALEDADVIVFLTDAVDGLQPADTEIADSLRRLNVPIVTAVNKSEGTRRRFNVAEFYALGLNDPIAISAIKGEGMADLLDAVEDELPPGAEAELDEGFLRLAIVGRPNVGKSSIMNAITGEERAIVDEAPGTTRDSLDAWVSYDGNPLLLIDTAGMRRRGHIVPGPEKFSVLRSLQSIERCNVAVLVMDATELATAQDVHVAGYVLESYHAMLVAVNKWDLAREHETEVIQEIRKKLHWAPYVPIHFVSALTGEGLDGLLTTAQELYREQATEVGAAELNTTIVEAMAKHPPRSQGRRQLRLYRGEQSQVHPLGFTLYVNNPEIVHFSYRRYLLNTIRSAFSIRRVPIRLDIRKGARRRSQ